MGGTFLGGIGRGRKLRRGGDGRGGVMMERKMALVIEVVVRE